MNKILHIFGHTIEIRADNWRDELIAAIKRHPRGRMGDKIGKIIALRDNSHIVPVGELDKGDYGELAGLRASKEFVEMYLP